MATTTNYGWTTPDDTALVKDGASAIRTLGSSVDTTTKALNPSTTLGDIEYRSSTSNTNTRVGIGSSGQALTVVAGVPSWAASATSVLTTTGDVLYASAANTLARLGVGSTGQILTVAGGVPTWATAAGGGKVLQVVYARYNTETTIASTTQTNSGLTATITPSNVSSKILVIFNQALAVSRGSNVQVNGTTILYRGATSIHNEEQAGIQAATGSATEIRLTTTVGASYLDSPATTSATTYKTMCNVNTTASTGQVVAQYNNSYSTMTLLEIGA
jgi:hypothetical protein